MNLLANVSRRVAGFVKIVALSVNGHQLGESSSHSGKSRRVILRPGTGIPVVTPPR